MFFRLWGFAMKHYRWQICLFGMSSFISNFHGYVSWPPGPHFQPQPCPKRANLQPAGPAVELPFRLRGKTSALTSSSAAPASQLGCWWHSSLSLCVQVRDYSGTYTVKLIACTTAPHQEYSLPVICNPREPITFDLDIRFQQVPFQWHLCHVSFLIWFPFVGLVAIVLETEFLANKESIPKLVGEHILLSW